MRVKFLKAGYCTHPEFMVRKGGSFSVKHFPATVAYIEHPRYGKILFDTGYSLDFYQATRKFPEKLYALVTPVYVTEKDTAAYQLTQMGIHPEEIDYVILSHFHADHMAGIADFPRAQYLFLNEAFEHVNSLNRFGRVKAGFLRELLPHDFDKRAKAISINETINIGNAISPFAKGWDLFGDGSILGIPLPGHAKGHMGLLVRADTNDYFMVSDACWSEDQFIEKTSVNFLTYLIMDDRKSYLGTLDKLHEVYHQRPELTIVPCHCEQAHAKLD